MARGPCAHVNLIAEGMTSLRPWDTECRPAYLYARRGYATQATRHIPPITTVPHSQPPMVAGVQIHSQHAQQAQTEILTEDALTFLAALHRTFESTRQSLLVAREAAQQRLDAGQPLDFPSETAHIRADPSWLCAVPAPGLEDRRVEITGPTDRKMVINALNSGAKTFMADFEGAFAALHAGM